MAIDRPPFDETDRRILRALLPYRAKTGPCMAELQRVCDIGSPLTIRRRLNNLKELSLVRWRKRAKARAYEYEVHLTSKGVTMALSMEARNAGSERK